MHVGPDLNEAVRRVVRADMRRNADVGECRRVTTRVVAEHNPVAELFRIGLAFETYKPRAGDPVGWTGFWVEGSEFA